MNVWRTRTVRNGRVKIDGQWFYPRDVHREYKGEMDGGRYLFGRYVVGNEYKPFVSLWGSEEMAKAGAMAETDEELRAAMDAVKHTQKNVISGYIYWQFWYPKEGENVN